MERRAAGPGHQVIECVAALLAIQLSIVRHTLPDRS
jgi:hypothetical protein